jgi:cobalt/nickel transport system permease protein
VASALVTANRSHLQSAAGLAANSSQKGGTVHIPDGFIDGPVSAAGGAAAVGLVGASVKMAAKELDDRQVPRAGLTAAFVFAVQMLNFPVAGGTSGHLLGGALAAVLVGPWVATVCMAVVVGVQALVFADGGLSALGLNIVLMGGVTCFVGYAVFLLARRFAPATKGAVAVASGLAAWFGVMVAAVVFVVLYAIGGSGDASITTVATGMVGVHALIGIGEAVITASTVGAVLGTRPDLVYGARDLQLRLAVRVPATTPIGRER